MFINEYYHNLDEKGRITMPSKFREQLGDELFLTKGMEKCLFCYPKTGFYILTDKLNKLSLTRKEARAFSRMFFAGASNQKFDKQGRFLIPKNLREYANITSDVAIIGVSSRIEIWDKKAWEDYSNLNSMKFDELSEQIADLDL
ncbi:MAG: division/cell wall cluster transcriptional repressor MraZ [Finegoldia sp.]|nr:division/cell wall cluster transcriptional repressor MraZ [Finegoldia sp.]